MPEPTIYPTREPSPTQRWLGFLGVTVAAVVITSLAVMFLIDEPLLLADLQPPLRLDVSDEENAYW